MGMAQILFRNDFQQTLLHLIGRFSRRQSRAVSHAEEVGINRDGGFAKNDIQNHIGGFAPHAGKGFKGFAFARNFARMFLNKDF